MAMAIVAQPTRARGWIRRSAFKRSSLGCGLSGLGGGRPRSRDGEGEAGPLYVDEQRRVVRGEDASCELGFVHPVPPDVIRPSIGREADEVLASDVGRQRVILADEEVSPRRDRQIVGIGEQVTRGRFEEELERARICFLVRLALVG